MRFPALGWTAGFPWPYLHHGGDELRQHGQGESQDVEERDGGESLARSEHVVRAHCDVHSK